MCIVANLLYSWYVPIFKNPKQDNSEHESEKKVGISEIRIGVS